MSYKTFVNGFPLNASELNEYLMSQVIAVFVDATARNAAIETPTEGQFAYLTGSNVLTFYNGTAWENFGTVPTFTANRAIASNGSGALTASTVTATELGFLSGVTSGIQTQLDNGGLVKITNQSFSASTAVNVNNVFSSTYTNYRIVMDWTASVNQILYMRLRNAGTDYSTGNKYFTYAWNGVWGNVDAPDANQWTVGYNNSSPTQGGLIIDIFRPAVSGETSLTFQQVGGKSGSYLYAAVQGAAGVWNTRTDDGFTLYPSAGNMTGNVRVYGWRN